MALQKLKFLFCLCVCFFSSGFAWILPGRLVNDFPSTGQTLVWRKLRLPHIEGVGEWQSGHNQYLNSYTNHPHPPTQATSLSCAQLLSSHDFFPAIPKSHPRCLALFLSLCGSNTDPSGLIHLQNLKQKWNDTKRIAKKATLHLIIFLACLCAFSLSWAFLWTEKAMTWNYFLISAYL